MNNSISDLVKQMQSIFESQNGTLAGGFLSLSNTSSGNNPQYLGSVNEGGCSNTHSCPDGDNQGPCSNFNCPKSHNAGNGRGDKCSPPKVVHNDRCTVSDQLIKS